MDESHLRDLWIVFIPKPKEQKVIIFCINNLKHLQDLRFLFVTYAVIYRIASTFLGH